FGRRCGGFQQQSQIDYQKGVWLSHLSSHRNRLVSSTWKSTRTEIRPQFLVRRPIDRAVVHRRQRAAILQIATASLSSRSILHADRQIVKHAARLLSAGLAQFVARPLDRRVSAEHSAQQETFRLLTDRLRPPLHLRAADRAVGSEQVPHHLDGLCCNSCCSSGTKGARSFWHVSQTLPFLPGSN